VTVINDQLLWGISADRAAPLLRIEHVLPLLCGDSVSSEVVLAHNLWWPGSVDPFRLAPMGRIAGPATDSQHRSVPRELFDRKNLLTRSADSEGLAALWTETVRSTSPFVSPHTSAPLAFCMHSERIAVTLPGVVVPMAPSPSHMLVIATLDRARPGHGLTVPNELPERSIVYLTTPSPVRPRSRVPSR
jgi:hypothetical protein